MWEWKAAQTDGNVALHLGAGVSGGASLRLPLPSRDSQADGGSVS